MADVQLWSQLSEKYSWLADPSQWILASASPRRSQLCSSMGWIPTITPSDFAEDLNPCNFHQPEDYATKTAEMKALTVYKKKLHQYNSTKNENNLKEDNIKMPKFIVSADTIVVTPKGTVLEKPKDRSDALRMLQLLSQGTHKVITAVVIISILSTQPKDYSLRSFSESTQVEFSSLPSEVLEKYTQLSKEPMDKAGACAYQGIPACMMKRITGCYYNAIGFPLHAFFQFLFSSSGPSTDNLKLL